MDYKFEELKVVPSREEVGWTVQENVGIGIINTQVFWPWWKKLFYKFSFKSMKRKRIIKKYMKTIRESEWKESLNKQIG
jgi:hypothetical protein